jgi:putative peptidoglycan lipid II flippase
VSDPSAEPPATTPERRSTPPRVSIVRSSAVLAAGTMASRLTGFVRTAVLVAAIGLGTVGDAYTVSIQLPNVVYELLLGGILTSVVVPLLVKAQSDDDGGKAFTDRLLSLALVLFCAVTAVAVAAAPLITDLYLSDKVTGAKVELTTQLSQLSFLAIAFLGMSALLGAVLNAKETFFATGWAPVVNNLVVIVIGGVLIALTTGTDLNSASISSTVTLLLGLTFPVGVAAQAAILWYAMRRNGYRWRWRLDVRGSGLGEVGRLAKWMICYVLISQVGVLVLVNLLSANSGDDRGGPGNAVHQNAFLLFMLPHGIVAVSVITALLPQMSRAAAAGEFAQVANRLNQGIRLSSTVLVPATAAFLALGVPIAVLVYGHGQAQPGLVTATGWATVAAGIGLVPFAVSQLQIFAFYAMRDTKTPALVNIAVVAAKVAAYWVAFVVLPPKWTVVGFMMANTLSYLVAVALTAWLLRKRVGRLGTVRILRTLTRLTVAATVGGLAGWAVGYGAQAWLGTSALGSGVAVFAGGAALLAVFGGGAMLMRVSEITEIVGTVRGRLGSS